LDDRRVRSARAFSRSRAAGARSRRHARRTQAGVVATGRAARNAGRAARGGRIGAAIDGLFPTALVGAEHLRRVVAGADVVHSIAREWAGPLERAARGAGAAFVETPLVHPGQPFSGAGRDDVARYRRDDAVIALTEWEAGWYRERGIGHVHV